MSAELVTVTIDDRQVQVAKGLGVVEAALTAGIEIPVFCYEPRLGEPIGACRMCLVELEGVPKLQTACTLTAQDGMVVRTAHTSAKAAEGQESTLEFILVNHPLDCPVCDKGGECPLQDLTFRYGPGRTRMTFDKVTVDKPIPISPHIALDRERCILCYRCTRFSEEVAADGELVAINRGRASMIATFDDEPYRGRFSGNVIELCPVGALTSTEYRFEGRPWEIQGVPTTCALCPVGCNVEATVREGKVKRILARNHPEVDQGWLCDKGRFTFPAYRAADRIVDPLRRVRRRGIETGSWDDALADAERLLREAGSNVLFVFSGTESNELAYGLAKVAAAIGATVRLPEEVPPPSGRPLSAIADAKTIGYVGDVPAEELAPIVDLWVRLARRRGAQIVDGADAEITIGRDPSATYWLPSTPNSRGVADAVARAGAGVRGSEPAAKPVRVGGPGEGVSGKPGGSPAPALLFVSGDEAASDASVRALAESAQAVIVTAMFQGLAVGWADVVLPGTSYLERDGSTTNLEGRVQRLRRSVLPPAPDELAWLAKLAERLGVELSPYAPVLYEELFGESYADLGEEAALGAREQVAQSHKVEQRRRGTRLVRYKPLFSGPAVERVENLQFQRPEPAVELSPEDAARLKIASGEEVVLRTNGTSARLRARVRAGATSGVVLVADEHAGQLAEGPVEVTR